jgi:hypothetical protein
MRPPTARPSQGAQALAALDQADVRAMQPGTMRELLLRHVRALAQCAYPIPELFRKSPAVHEVDQPAGLSTIQLQTMRNMYPVEK